MKCIIFLSCILTLNLVLSQNKLEIIHNEDASKKGIGLVNGNSTQTKIEPIYDEILNGSNCFVLLEKKVTKNGVLKKYENVTIIDLEFETLAHFDYLDQKIKSLLILKKGKQANLFDLEKGSFLLKNVDQIEWKTTKSGIFLIWQAPEKSGVIKSNGEKVLFNNENKTIEIDIYNQYIKSGSAPFDLYDLDGKLVYKNVMDYSRFWGSGMSRYYCLTLENKKQTVIHYNHVLIPEIEGEFKMVQKNPNRFRLWTNEGYTILDSAGRRISGSPLETTFTVTIGEDEKGVLPNLVEDQNGDWLFVDNNFMPIDQELYQDAIVIDDTDDDIYLYLIGKGKDDLIQYYLYDRYGKQINELPVSSAYYKFSNENEAIVAEQNGKKGISFYGISFSDFVYDNVNLIPNLDLNMAICESYGMMVLVEGSEKQFFEPDQLYSANSLSEQYEEGSILMIRKTKKGPFSLAKYEPEKENFNLYGDFKLENLNWNQDLYYHSPKSFCIAEKEGLFGIISISELTTIIPCQYDKIDLNLELYDLGLINIYQKNKIGLLKLNEQEINEFITPKYDEIKLTDPFIIVKEANLYGIVDPKTGIEILNPCLLEEPDENFLYAEKPESFAYPIKALKDGQEIYCYNSGKGKFHFGSKITAPLWGDETLYFIDVNGKTGMINEYYDTILKPIYTSIELSKNEDYLKTEIDGKYGLRNWNGSTVIEEQYDNILYLENLNAFLVEQNKKQGLYFNKNKKLQAKYDQIIVDMGDIFTQEKETWYLFDLDLNIIDQAQTKSLKEFKDQFYKKQ